MKIKMFVRGGSFLIPTEYKPHSNNMFNVGVYIDCNLRQVQEICNLQQTKLRWKKIDIETPNGFEIPGKCFTFSYLYSNTIEPRIHYSNREFQYKINLICETTWKYCYISNIEVTNY